jgi:ribosomal-protein-alanine N-acetyltransferase
LTSINKHITLYDYKFNDIFKDTYSIYYRLKIILVYFKITSKFMKSYKIREPKREEIIKSIKVMLISFGRPPLNNFEEEKTVWTHLIDKKIAKFLIAIKDDNIIGLGGVFLFQKVASIGYMGVLPEYRGQGIGSEIFKELMEIAKNSGCNTVNLFASKLGEPIYRKYGFQGNFYANLYLLPKKANKLQINNNHIESLSKFPEWALELDYKVSGFDRSNYLKARTALGAKVLVAENEGYGLISNILSTRRLGPLITTTPETAVQIVKKALQLGAESMIIPSHPLFQNKIISLIGLTEHGDPNLKMTYGSNLTRKLEYLYAIGTYSKG